MTNSNIENGFSDKEKNIEKIGNHTNLENPLKVLIIDDDERVKGLLVKLLSMQGCEASSVSSGISALKKFEKGQFDVIITDWDMHDLTGTEVAKAIRRIDPNAIIFVMTGWSVETIISENTRGLFDRIIKKPFRLEIITKNLEWVKAVRAMQNKYPEGPKPISPQEC